jgi:hypothetical protein
MHGDREQAALVFLLLYFYFIFFYLFLALLAVLINNSSFIGCNSSDTFESVFLTSNYSMKGTNNGRILVDHLSVEPEHLSFTFL